MSWRRARPEPGSLQGADAVVWRVRLAGERRADLGALSDAERARAARYLDAERGEMFARTRAALRSILAPLCGEHPARLRFGAGARGKPHLLGARRPQWNVSHAGDWALIAVCADPIGVDLERSLPRPPEELAPIARRVFTRDELRAWCQAPRSDRARLFYRLWVRKEAYMKWDGAGFALGPSALAIGWGAPLTRAPPPEAQSAPPTIADLDVDKHHPAALCARRPLGAVRLLTWQGSGSKSGAR